MDNVDQGWTVPIIRQMTINENRLGLGSLWDVERHNADLDEARDAERDRKARLYARDAIVALGLDSGLSVFVTGVERPVHAARIGLRWIDGAVCGTTERAVIPDGSIDLVATNAVCDCDSPSVRDYPFVTLGAVLRELERTAAEVTVVAGRRGVRGRITGVWKDALSVTSSQGESVVPVEALSVVIVDDCRRA